MAYDRSVTRRGPIGPTAERVAAGASLLVLSIGMLVLVVGWWGGVDIVTRLLPDLVSMKANTAIGFVLSAIAIWPRVRRWSPAAADGAATVVTLVGGLTWIEYSWAVDLGIDQLLATETNLTGTAAPGRMGLNSAIGFALLGMAMLAAARSRRSRWPQAGQTVGLIVGLLGLLALLGYLLGATSAVGIGSATEMALHTSALFVMSAIALSATTSDVGLLRVLSSKLDTGRAARRLVPVMMASVLFAVGLVELLARTPLLDDVRLQLALVATLSVAVVGVGALIVLKMSAVAEGDAERVRRDLDTVRAAFRDVLLRILPDDSIIAMQGEGARHDLAPDAVGRPISEVLPDGAAAAFATGLAGARSSGRAHTVTFGDDIDDRSFEARIVPMDDSSDMAVSIREVSDLVRAKEDLQTLAHSLEAQVQDRTRDLEASNRELERFAYLASHDLQEPLRMVTGFVGRIASKYGDVLDDRGKEYIHYAVDGAERMSKLIEGLLAYSRAGTVDPDRIVATDLATLAEQAAGTLADLVEEVGGSVTLDVEPALVAGDPTLLRQVIQNLMSNALKFTRPDTPPVVVVRTRVTSGGGCVTVEDQGIGIAAEHREEVFSMFRRVSTDPAHRGTGIGLSLVQQMVDAHHGTIEIADGTDGVGTRFDVTIPSPSEATT